MSNEVKPLNSLTGLRIVAASAVFFHHVSGHFGIPKFRIPLGAWGVSFFFVLSGFILTYVYCGRLTRQSIGKFYFTRWARIWPLHIVCLGLIFVAFSGQATIDQPGFFGKLVVTVLLLQSWVPQPEYNFAFNAVAWSISTEMFFYAVFPFFLIGGSKRFWVKYFCLLGTMVLVLPLFSALSKTGLLPDLDFKQIAQCNPLFRLAEFCTGMAAGFWFLKKKPADNAAAKRNRWWKDSLSELLVTGGMLVYLILVTKTNLMSWVQQAEWGSEFLSSVVRYSSACMVFALLIYVFASSRGVFGRILGTKPMVFLGEVSFAFYMVHQIVIRIVLEYSPYYSNIAPWWVGVLIATISLAVSVLLFKLVEMPCKNALLKFWNGHSSNVPRNSRYSFSAISNSPVVVISMLLIVVCGWLLGKHRLKNHHSSSVAAIIQTTEPQDRGIYFEGAAILQGFQVTPQNDGLEIVMIWQKSSNGPTGYRVVNVCDQSGKILNAVRDEKIISDASIGSTVEDRLLLSGKRLSVGHMICVGFHAPDKGSAKVLNGRRAIKNKRFVLVGQDRFKEIALHFTQPKRRMKKEIASPSSMTKKHSLRQARNAQRYRETQRSVR